MITQKEKEYLLSNRISTYSENTNLLNKIEYIEPNYEVSLFNENINVNWNNEMIHTSFAAEYGCYGNGINIAVIDSGMYTHKYLSNCLFDGYNYIDNSKNVNDTIGHGTFVTSIIAAESNEQYLSGTASKSNIVSLKCFDKGYSTKISLIAKAIYDAVDKYDCRIINMSFGLSNNSTTLNSAIDYAISKNVILIAAVGNNGTSNLQYPAAYDGVIGVGSVNSNSEYSLFSQFNNSVDVVAPGENINGILINNYDIVSGTSFSAPHVSAAAAIALCIDEDITPQKFYDLIQSTSTDLGETGYDLFYGNGLLNVGSMSEQLISEQEIFMSPINIENSSSKVTIVNNQSDSLVLAIFADYNGKCLNNCIFNNVNLISKEKIDIYYPIEGDHIKYFIWNNAKQLVPLTKVREYMIDGGE